MKKALLLMTLPLCVAMSGCIPTETGFKQLMTSYQGQHIDNYIAKNGAPNGVHERQDGTKQYTFNQSRNIDMGSMTVYQPQSATAYSSTGQLYMFNTSTPQQIDMGSFTGVCNLQLFTDQAGIITHYEYRGNDCIALPPKKKTE